MRNVGGISYYTRTKRHNADLASFETLKYDTMISAEKHLKYQHPLNEGTITVFFLKKRVDLIFRNALIDSLSELNRTSAETAKKSLLIKPSKHAPVSTACTAPADSLLDPHSLLPQEACYSPRRYGLKQPPMW